MKIVNAMFSTGRGGIEQCLIDYCEALSLHGHKTTAMIHPSAPIRKELLALGNVNILGVKNKGQWDIFAKSYIKKMLKQAGAELVIAHGNRAVSLLKSPCKKLGIPLIGVSHNYSIKKLVGLDAVFTITKDLQEEVIAAGQPKDATFLAPNMVRVDPGVKNTFVGFKSPPVIGTMGRFVKKKGFAEFLHALHHLKEQGHVFGAIIGGRGEEYEALYSLSQRLGLQDCVTFAGWVQDKNTFFNDIDIFCLPSLHEPFGIILLEAFAAGKPVVTTDSEGPREIVSDRKNALMVKRGDIEELADKLARLLSSEELARELSYAGAEDVKKYCLPEVSKLLNQHVNAVYEQYHSDK